MKNHTTRLIAVALSFTFAVPAGGQDIGETLKSLLEDNARGYMGPISTAFGTAVNSGTYHRAKPHKILGFDLTFNLAIATVPEGGQFYDFVLPEQVILPIDNNLIPELGTEVINIEFIGADLYAGNNLRSATFFGPDSSFAIVPNSSYASSQVQNALAGKVPQQVIDNAMDVILNAIDQNLTIPTPVGIDFPALFMPIPQVSVGLPFSTEVTLGGFSLSAGETDLSFSRFGAKIGLNQFIPTVPLLFPAVSLGFYVTNLDLGDVVKAKNSILTLQVSKSVPFITVYGGFGFENSSIEVDYTFVDEDLGEVPIAFSLDGDNGFRTTIGFRLKLLLLSLHGDYSVGEYSAITLGAGLTLR